LDWFLIIRFITKKPFCDSTHKALWTTYKKKRPALVKYRPIKYVAEETKDVWFCNCKQSSNRPFCDGTHKTDLIQTAESVKE
jgi:CDGSH-type Zn-finger protein